MTSDYYFKKWKNTLEKLNTIVELDLEYQVSSRDSISTHYFIDTIIGLLLFWTCPKYQ